MTTRIQKTLTEKGQHHVGNLCSLKIKTVAHGAIVADADIDNFSLGELGFDANGERTVTQLSVKTNKAVLVASPEARYMNEELVDFYNEVGEPARCVILEPGYTRFDTSAYSLNTGVTEITNGQVAHFDPTTKKFIISASGTPHADYAGSSAQFLVVNSEDDLEYVAGMACVRLECTKA